MSANPLVSVIVPAHNSGRFIAETLDSALKQDYRPMEVVVVDDGSTDDTREVVARFGDRVRYHFQKNSGPSPARNFAISQSKGEIIAFLDADDIWAPDKLSTQVPLLLASPDVALVHSDLNFLDNDTGRVYYEYRPKEKYQGDCYQALFFSNNVVPSTVIVRKSAIEAVGAFDPTLVHAEDYELFLRLARRYRFAYVPKALTNYRLHGSNLSRNKARMIQAVLEVCRRTLAADSELAGAIGAPKLNRHMAGLAFSAGYQHALAGDRKTARRLYLTSLGYEPANLGTWKSLAATMVPAGLRNSVSQARRSQAS